MTDSSRKSINIVLAILVSVAAWIFVVYNYEPMTEVRYADVPVSFTGERELAERGLAVDEVSAEGVTVTLSQRRTDTARISADDIKITADVSGCVAGSNSIELSISGPADTTVVNSDTHLVGVTVDRAKSAEMDIDVLYTGEGIPEDAEPIATDMSRMVAEVECTADRLKDIDKVAALLEYSEVTDKTKSFTVDLAAVDKEGNVIPHVVIYPEEISLDASAGFTKEVSLSVPVKVKSDDNYERKYVTPDTVVLKGPEGSLDNIGTIRAYDVDISGEYENGEMPIEYNLPEGVYVANESLGQVVRYTVMEKETTEEDEDN